jgi:hypothetical protein
MFELSKQILQKVSFDKILFRKELSKAVKWLKPDERILLYAWCISTFGHMYKNEIIDVFKTVVKA